MIYPEKLHMIKLKWPWDILFLHNQGFWNVDLLSMTIFYIIGTPSTNVLLCFTKRVLGTAATPIDPVFCHDKHNFLYLLSY